MADVPVEPCIGHPGAPEIKRRMQPLTLIRPQPIAGLTHLLAPLGDAIAALAALPRLPVAADTGLFGRSALLILGLLLIPGCAFALRRAGTLCVAVSFRITGLLGALALGRSGTLRIAFAFRLTQLFGPVLTHTAVLLALGRPLAITARLLRLGLAVALTSRRNFRAARGAVNARSSFGLNRARRLALRYRPSGARRTHAAGMASAWRTARPLTTTRTLCRNRAGVSGEQATCERRHKNSSHDWDSFLGMSLLWQRPASNRVPLLHCERHAKAGNFGRNVQVQFVSADWRQCGRRLEKLRSLSWPPNTASNVGMWHLARAVLPQTVPGMIHRDELL